MRGRYAALAVVVVAVVALAAGGCGAASPDSPPSGVDELVIPTPTPDPSDFVPSVDNRWLPLEAGSTWTYGLRGESTGTVTVRVLPETEPVAGVTTTAVERTVTSDTVGASDVTVDYFAQDRRGNVWWFGRRGEWRAGEDGAEAGLAMPASPRLGDGWRAGYRPGVVDVRVSVSSVGATISTPAGEYDDVVRLEVGSPSEPDSARLVSYAPGVGPVEEISLSGPVTALELESGP